MLSPGSGHNNSLCPALVGQTRDTPGPNRSYSVSSQVPTRGKDTRARTITIQHHHQPLTITIT